MKRIYGPTLAVFAALGLAYPYPVSMDIGAFAIDNYSNNGGGMGNLGQQVAGGQNFFWAAQANIPPYAGANTGAPSLAVDARNTAVTKAALTNTSSAYGNREYADFLYFGGHGLNGGVIYLGAGNPPYGQAVPSELNLGTGYNRWFLANSCSLFNGGDPATIWQPAFKGLKAMLGFKSFIFDNNLSWDLYNDFWLNWTSREKSLMISFFDSQSNYGYKHLFPSKGMEPGCLSAQYSNGSFDYCREFFRLVAHDYSKAIANTGYYYSKVIGAPQY
jgi:hypothetical protein